MKHIKRLFTMGISMALTLQIAMAQNYKMNPKSGTQVVVQNLVGKISVEETVAGEMEISVDNLRDVLPPEKAKGLKAISSTGLEDNTGIGLNVSTKGTKIIVSGVSKSSADGHYTIKVPKGLSCKIDYNSPFAHDDLKINGFSGELEISTMNSDIFLESVTGPLLLNSINGDINIAFSNVNQKAPISITTINGEIDVTIPAGTAAELSMSSLQGEIYTDFDIDFKQKYEKEGLTYVGGGQDVEGNINGGGVDILLKTINDNIYLRKK